MKLTITGIIYLDGCTSFIGTAIDLTGMQLNVIFPDDQRVALLDTIDATGEMVTSPHHAGRPAFAIYSMKMLQRGTIGSVRRLRGKAKVKVSTKEHAGHAPASPTETSENVHGGLTERGN